MPPLRPRRRWIAFLVLAVSACTPKPAADPTPPVVVAPAADPMANFTRLAPGEWRQTAASGTSMLHAWHWGPGKHSVRRTTDGADAGGNPWSELQVFYRHPARPRVAVLTMSLYARGVGEGAITFDGPTADATYDLYQTGGRRSMGVRWAFEGPDQYRETLLEATGPAGLTPLAEWVHVRTPPAAAKPPAAAAPPSERLTMLAPVVGRAWEAAIAGRVRSTVERVPLLDAVYVRVVAADSSAHLFDAYVYHHTGTGATRCLALSSAGGVYEGELVVRDGAVQLDLTGYEGDRVVPYVVRFEVERDGAVRQRVWAGGTDRPATLDVRHVEAK